MTRIDYTSRDAASPPKFTHQVADLLRRKPGQEASHG